MMKHQFVFWFVWSVMVQSLFGATFKVSSAEEIEALMKSEKLSEGDTIIWADGDYPDEELKLVKVHGSEGKPIILKAETPGGVILRGESRFSFGVKWWVIEGPSF